MSQFITIVSDDETFPVMFGDSVVFCRRYSLAAHQRIEKQVGRKRRDRLGHWYLDIDEHAMNAAAMDYLVDRWENVKGPDGRDVPCTKENKIKLPLDVTTQIMEETGASSIMGAEDREADPLETSDSSSSAGA